MDRRRFLFQASAAAVATASCSLSKAQSLPTVSAELTLRAEPGAPQVPLTYAGLSYELAQLTDPQFFSVANRDLVEYFRLLSPQGVLRVGGDTSEFCWFKANASTPEPKLHLPAGNLEANWMPHRLFAISPEAIDALAGFLQATGWRLIYGLNFGNSTPERAAAEAEYVAQAVGGRLEFFQIGNEPDFYHDANNGTRPPDWGFAEYMKEWVGFAEAIGAKVPGVRLGGPDVGASSAWVTRFAAALPAEFDARVVALTGHYYAEGPPDDPRVTIERLLGGNPDVPAQTRRIEAAARARGRAYRMTEGNSCYRGGKPGMSNAFAAALWAGDYMLQLAGLGCAGVNLHGGSSAFLTAGLGDHTPGMEASKGPQTVRSGFYTPISSEPGSAVKATPVFYGMLLASQFAGGTFLRVDGSMEGVNTTAYAAQHKTGFKVAVFNKGELKPIDLSIRAPRGVESATAWRMQAPALDSTERVTLAGAEIQAHAKWRPKVVEHVAVRNGIPRLRIPAGSAVLLFLK
ncbi:MAG: glycosyl hydrolase family 79 C-terminal domain-containing protein [Terracidiphilus sp.]|jgi:hypothetical protein